MRFIHFTRTVRYLLVPVLAAGIASAGSQKIAKDLQQADQSKAADVIVQFAHTPGTKQHQLVRNRGGQHKKDLTLVKGAVYSIAPGQLESLAADPEVVYISPDRPVKAMLDNAAVAIGADIARKSGYDGSNVGIAVIDSGIAPAIDLKSYCRSRVVYGQSFVPSDTSTGDAYGHGTAVAGIAAGNGSQSTCSTCFTTYRGIAPNANLINLRVLDKDGLGTDSAVIHAIQQAINLKRTYNIRILNLSLGRPVFESYKTDPLCQAVEAAWRSGIVVVVAAGNNGRDDSMGTDGYATIASPGNDPYVITVGAMKTMGTGPRGDDLIATYSSKGPTLVDHVVKPDLVAPGNMIASILASPTDTLARVYPGNIVDLSSFRAYATGPSSYYRLSGTSMAAPMVSGAAALLLEKAPYLTPDQVKARLMRTASKTFPTYSTVFDPVTSQTYTSQYDIFTVGAGYLDVWSALNDMSLATGTALSPIAVLDSKKNTVSLVFDNGVVWGTGIVWGTGVVWGTAVVSTTGLIWGTGVVWGTGDALSGSGVIWGTGIVWGTGVPGGTGLLQSSTGIALDTSGVLEPAPALVDSIGNVGIAATGEK